MTAFKEECLEKIRKNLQENWNNQAQKEINKKLRLSKKVGAAKAAYSRELSSNSTKAFEELWKSKFYLQFSDKFDELEQVLNKKIAARHEWLSSEENAKESQNSLLSIFLIESIEKFILETLKSIHKKIITSWQEITFDTKTKFEWNDLKECEDYLNQQVAGYPLSNIDFYRDRKLPSFLDDPLTKPVTRYDIYRLLIKTYPDGFQPKKLKNNIFCTKIAPLHHSELEKLSEQEWDNFETIILNVGAEDNPEWVILDKKNNPVTIHTPNFLKEKITELKKKYSIINKAQSKVIDIQGKTIYSEIIDWNAILFSRILPWTQLSTPNKPELNTYRDTIPISLLTQSLIESSCLDDQISYKKSSLLAFNRRYPLSMLSEKTIYNSENENIECLFSDITNTDANTIFKKFDNHNIIFNHDTSTITVNSQEAEAEALKIAYFFKVNTLKIEITPNKSLQDWYTYNLDITKIITSNHIECAYIYACAARNRFLEYQNKNYLQQNKNGEFAARREAWQNTGELIYKYLQGNTNNPQQTSNIAEMGKHGLDTLFNYLATIDKPINFDCTISLESGHSCPVSNYIKHLQTKIQTINKESKPLFNSLTLALPNKLDSDSKNIEALCELINTIHEAGELTEIKFTNEEAITSEFLQDLTNYVEKNKICLQIKIPAWDKTTFENKNKRSLKVQYRHLQNQILTNIRSTRLAELKTNTESINTPPYIANPLKVINEEPLEQNWGTQKFKLNSEVAGIQQQAQQEVAQEVQQQAEQQKKPTTPMRREITTLPDGYELINRQNLKQYSVNSDDFSAWVGSSIDGNFTIQQIDKNALTQIRKYQSLFRFGIDPEHTPGFRLYYAADNNKSLVLTFDANLEEKDIKDLKENPFAIKMNSCKSAKNFVGDYRQLREFIADEKSQVTLWKYLAKEEELPDNIKNWLKKNTEETETTESLQYYDINNSIPDTKTTLENINNIIKKWSNIDDDTFFTELMRDLSTANLQAFGQLFYHYTAQGNLQWINLAHQIYQTFPDKFHIYKKNILDNLEDWSECLEQTEVESLTTAIQKIKGHPVHTDIIWKLIEIHGNIVGRTRFAEVWSGFDMVISYINDHDLEINKEEFINAINNYKDIFNATQFLRRIHEVLQNTSNRRDSKEIQQNILNNLSEIDWREDGFYYACIHEHYRYWDRNLEFTKLENLNGSPTGSYIATWNNINLDNIKNPKAYVLRFAAQKLKLNYANFQKFKEIITKIDTECDTNKTVIMRLATAAITIGIDDLNSLEKINWQELSNADYADKLKLIDKLIHLDTDELRNNSYHVQMQDLKILINNLKNETLNLDNLNSLGRALQAFKEDKAAKLEKLIKHASKNSFSDPLVNVYPWLINETEENLTELTNIQKNKEIQKFYQQLQSINFAESKKLPDYGELQKDLSSINNEETRRKAIKKYVEDGCVITDQDAGFITLPKNKQDMIDDLFLAKTFAEQNRKLLQELFKHLAIKPEGNDDEKVANFLNLCAELGRKSHFDELGQLLGLLIEKSQENQYYSIEQLTAWLTAVYDENEFKTKPYPVTFIKLLLEDALASDDSSLLVPLSKLNQLKVSEAELEPLKNLMSQINLKSLPYQAKKSLIQTAINYKMAEDVNQIIIDFEQIFNQIKNTPHTTTILCNFINKQLEQGGQLKNQISTLQNITTPYETANKTLKELWQNCQTKLLKDLTANNIDQNIIEQLAEIKDPLTRMIIIQALSTEDTLEDIQKKYLPKINKLSLNARQKLAEYYANNPKPSLEQIAQLLKESNNNIDDAINKFEMDVLPNQKRHYSLDPKDAKDLNRVLTEIKLKGNIKIHNTEKSKLLNLLFYTNNYSKAVLLEKKSYTEILEIIHENVVINKNPDKKASHDAAKARILACIREVIARKTGKWMHHTQMMDLLYSVTHDDDNLLHQIRMGEGKSLISLARVAYRALNGRVVDVFSSKNSLSSRDHEESSPVLDALGIRHSHITPNSKPEEYHNTLVNGIGTVHYSTIGNWSLFLTKHFWDEKTGKFNIDLFAKWRDAFLDEGDHLMRIEDTMFNFSDQIGGNVVYNYDAWVYQITYKYFLEIQEKLNDEDFEITENIHLKELFTRLKEGFKTIAPAESTIFQNQIAVNDAEIRNKKLIELLTAARIANGLTEGGPFCVMEETKEISDSAALDTKFAKVMINNQVYHGSTYSDYVQQFLHERLNQEAAKNNQIPNFFIEPESEIVLSLNAPFILKHFFAHLEAVTGTPGGVDALDFYREEFDISRVIKLPTHEENKTLFLEPIYCTDKNNVTAQEEQIQKIADSITENPNQAILITCEDDREVEILGRLIAEALGEREPKVIIDTNSKGLSEAEVLRNAGKNGAVTISARLGRGSDIKPSNKNQGLRVIRTYPADPEIVKQEQGRQGRNGAPGVCQDIINYNKVQKEIEKYKSSQDYREQFERIYNNEKQHLEIKLEKHNKRKNDHKKIWQSINSDSDIKEKYLQTRSLQKLKHEIKEKSKKIMHEKNTWIIQGSAQVMEFLRTNTNADLKQEVKTEWRKCKKAIERAKNSDAEKLLSNFTKRYPQIPDIYPIPAKELTIEDEDNIEHANISEQLAFYQEWVKHICSDQFNPTEEVRNAIFTQTSDELEELFQKFLLLDSKQMQMLTTAVKDHQLCQYVSCQTWKEALNYLHEENTEISSNFDSRIQAFFKKPHKIPTNAEEVKSLNKAFITAIEGTPDKDFIIEIIKEYFTGQQLSYLENLVNSKFDKRIIEICHNNMHEEDIILLLETLYNSQEKNILEFLQNHNQNLKNNANLIRPLLPLIAYQCHIPNIDNNNESLFHFLSKRPIYTKEDMQKIERKINLIIDPKNQNQFMQLLERIPTHINLISILKDLRTLPGKYSFTGNNTELTNKIDRICNSGQMFNKFLFRYRIIDDTSKFTQPSNKELYNFWQDIYINFTLDEREVFFEEVSKHPDLNIRQIQELANKYKHNKDPIELQIDIKKILLPNNQQPNTYPQKTQTGNKKDGFFGSFSK